MAELWVLVAFTAAFVLIPGGVSKVARPGIVAVVLWGIGVRSPRGAKAVRRTTGLAELGLSAWLLGKPDSSLVVGAAAVLFALFALISWSHGRTTSREPCGCLGSIDLRLGWVSFGLNTGLTAALVASTLYALAGPSSESAASSVPLWMSAITLGLTYWVILYSASVLYRVSRIASRSLRTS